MSRRSGCKLLKKYVRGEQELHSGIISEKLHRAGAFYRESEWGGESLLTQSNGKPSIGSEQQLQRKSGGWRKDNKGIWKGDFP